MKKKYSEMLKIEKITNDIEETLKRNDNVSTDMFLTMRMEVIETIDDIDGQIDEILTSGDEEEYHFLKGLLKIDTQEQAMNTEYSDEKMLMLISLRTRNVLKGIIEKDKVMNKRLLGKESFLDDIPYLYNKEVLLEKIPFMLKRKTLEKNQGFSGRLIDHNGPPLVAPIFNSFINTSISQAFKLFSRLIGSAINTLPSKVVP